MVAASEAVVADKADLGREVRQDARPGAANGGRGGHAAKANERKVRARGARYPLSRRSFSLR